MPSNETVGSSKLDTKLPGPVHFSVMLWEVEPPFKTTESTTQLSSAPLAVAFLMTT